MIDANISYPHQIFENGYFTHCGKIINNYETLIEHLIDVNSVNGANIISSSINYHYRQKGGDILDEILKPITIIFQPIFKPIFVIADVFKFLIKLLIWMIQFIFWVIQFFAWLFTELLNPVVLIGSLIDVLTILVTSIITSFVAMISSVIKFFTQTMGNFVVNGFWGWDNAKTNKHDYSESKFFKDNAANSTQKCYATNPDDKVPFSVLVGTVILPPLGVFMTLGLTGWASILICTFLTLFYYVPGLLYAMCIIYC